jgi:GGDEF domain-containing protein/DNA-binding transcriptional MerR regulator
MSFFEETLMIIDDRNPQKVRILLQDAEIQGRVRENIRKGREEAKVTIGRASELFTIKPSKLRELDALLQPDRLAGIEPGQRQYSLAELQKLAIISELIRVGCSVTDIPSDIEKLWQDVAGLEMRQERGVEKREEAVQYLPINKRIEAARKNLFWRYFASHALRLSLSLICEDIPNSPAGLILPLNLGSNIVAVDSIKDLPKVGESLIGWLSQSRSSHTLLTSRPSFEYESDYSLLRLSEMKDEEPSQPPVDNTLIVLNRQDRRSARLTLDAPTVETVQRLLVPFYENTQKLRECFGSGMCDVLDPSTDFESNTNYLDIILTELADMIIQLGGYEEGKKRWFFCCILLSKDYTLPMQHRSLVVRAKSKDAPVQYKVGITTVSPKHNVNSLSLRAFQSGHTFFLPDISKTESLIAHREMEGEIHSAIAVPLGTENGRTVAVVYVTSHKKDAFSENDQRVLRLVGRMVEEAILLYNVRLETTKKLSSLIEQPAIVDPFFTDFLSENDFLQDLKILLNEVKTGSEAEEKQVYQKNTQYSVSDTLPLPLAEPATEEVVSFLAIDIDKLSNIGRKYGDQVTRNLWRAVGLRIEGQLSALFTPYPDCRLYHIYADKYYLMLKGISLAETRMQAERLRQALKGSYHIDALRTSMEESGRQTLPLELSNVTVRIAVTSYPYRKLRDFLKRPQYPTVNDIVATITGSLDEALKIGKDEQGDVVISWDPSPDVRMFVRWPPKENEKI